MVEVQIRRKRRLGVLLALLGAAVLMLISLQRPSALHQHPDMVPISQRDQVVAVNPDAPGLAAAPRLRVGVQMENAYNLSIPDQTFMADGWYWIDWPPAVQALIEANKLKMEGLVEIVNNIVGYDFEVAPETDEPTLRADGWRHQLFRFSGHFYVDDLDLRDSPFNLLSLPLIFETRPTAFAVDGSTPVLLLPEAHKQGLVGAYASIKGFQTIGASFEPMLHRYTTNFGEETPRQEYAQAVLRVFYRTPPWASFALWVLPLLIVMAIVFIAPSLESSLGDLRIAIPSTALLTLVVMQQTYQAELPPLAYLTFLDKLYLYSYLVSIALFVLFVWGSNVHSSALDDQRDQLTRRVERADRWFQILGLVGFVLAAALAWISG